MIFSQIWTSVFRVPVNTIANATWMEPLTSVNVQKLGKEQPAEVSATMEISCITFSLHGLDSFREHFLHSCNRNLFPRWGSLEIFRLVLSKCEGWLISKRNLFQQIWLNYSDSIPTKCWWLDYYRSQRVCCREKKMPRGRKGAQSVIIQ